MIVALIVVSVVAILALVAAVIAIFAVASRSKPQGSFVETVEGKFSEIFEMMGRLFGPRSEVMYESSPSGSVMLIRCQKCGKKNRLRDGIAGARCGHCHESLVRPEDKESPKSAPGGKVN